jgi:hypothetical protein
MVNLSRSVAPSNSDTPNPSAATAVTAVNQGVFICVHGHFYQPPRENPYLDAIEKQPGAAPCHDWNERIFYECYRPNAYARILNERGEVIRIVNNFEYISFNIGPTLMSWMERYDLETYQRILAADQASCQRLQGHGNAIAQIYNHIILPLANPARQSHPGALGYCRFSAAVWPRSGRHLAGGNGGGLPHPGSAGERGHSLYDSGSFPGAALSPPGEGWRGTGLVRSRWRPD